MDIHSQGARKNQFTFNLTGRAAAAINLAARPSLVSGAVAETAASRPQIRVLHRGTAKNHGNATQSGAILSVNVDDPKGNSIQINDAGSGTILVAWNGGAVHSFSGITTIVVNAGKARNDQVIFT